MSTISVPVSFGELIDKITILEIKSRRIGDETKLQHIRRELELLEGTWSEAKESHIDIAEERAALLSINETLWEIEDYIRIKESEGAFDEQFIELARSVYFRNDERAAIKRRINEKLGSEIVEEKSYAPYERAAD